MILDTHAEIIWSNRNKTWYESKGYVWTKNKEQFMVKIEDLLPSTATKIRVQCDYCDKIFKRDFCDIAEKIACRKCAGKYMSETKKKLTLERNLQKLTIENETCYLKVNEETTAIFDICFLSEFIKYGWFEDSAGYIATNIKTKGRYRQVKMHQLVTGKKGYDHVTRNKADNRMSNLRPATNQQNSMNIAPFNNKVSPYRGVAYHKQGQHYYARLKIREKTFRIGVFSDEVACANAYNYFAKELFGEYAYQNEVPYMTIDEWKSYRTSRQPVEEIMEQAKRWI